FLAIAQHVLCGSFHVSLADYLGLHYFRSTLFKPWQLVTHLFMHGDPRDLQETILHLFSNMFALWMFGSILENVWGPKRFLIFYLICGVGAAVLHMFVVGYEFHTMESAYNTYQQNPTLDQYMLFLKQHIPFISNNARLYE